jgi:15-cis-phytoene desaturase
VITADAYVSRLPVDVIKALMPEPWKGIDVFQRMQELEGVPVINIHLWFDRKMTDVDQLLFSRSTLAECVCRYEQHLSRICQTPISPCWSWCWPRLRIGLIKSEEEILAATMAELEAPFPRSPDGRRPG